MQTLSTAWQALQHEPGTSITSEGALATLSGTLLLPSCNFVLTSAVQLHCPGHTAAATCSVASHLLPLSAALLLLSCLPDIACTCHTGAKTGRSPRDKRVVREAESEGDIWWNKDKNGSPNFEMDERSVPVQLGCMDSSVCSITSKHNLPSLACMEVYPVPHEQQYKTMHPETQVKNCCVCRTFLLNRERAVDYLNMLDRLYVFDGYAGWDPEVSMEPYSA